LRGGRRLPRRRFAATIPTFFFELFSPPEAAASAPIFSDRVAINRISLAAPIGAELWVVFLRPTGRPNGLTH
jgi:hypothetical protein